MNLFSKLPMFFPVKLSAYTLYQTNADCSIGDMSGFFWALKGKSNYNLTVATPQMYVYLYISQLS